MIYIITGHYGSGKTEVAINLALTLSRPYIVDLDIVNPFFRTKDAAAKLESRGVRVISLQFANTNVDMPTFPPEVFAALQSGDDVVIDVGGDDDGAVVLGQFNAYFKEQPYEMLFVINERRPMTSAAAEVIEFIRAVEAVSRLKVTHLVNTANLKADTTEDDLLSGQQLVCEVSEITGIPVKCAAARRDIAEGLAGKLGVPIMPLDLHLTLPWERGGDNG